MHPGPMNRGVEIDPLVADSPAVADRQASALRARGAWPSSTTYSPAAPSGFRHSPRRRWRDALAEGSTRRERRRPRRARAGSGGGHRRAARGAHRRQGRSPRSPRRSTQTTTASSRPTGSSSRRRSSTRTSTSAPPGREDEETVASGTAAAAAGGYCAILAMPNTDPVVDSAATLGALVESARKERGGADRLPRRDHARPAPGRS